MMVIKGTLVHLVLKGDPGSVALTGEYLNHVVDSFTAKIHKMNTPLILLVVLVTTLVQTLSQCNETCTEWYTIIPGPTPHDSSDGIQSVSGRT